MSNCIQSNSCVPEKVKNTFSYHRMGDTARKVLEIFHSHKDKFTGIKISYADVEPYGISYFGYSFSIKRLVTSGFITRKRNGKKYLYIVTDHNIGKEFANNLRRKLKSGKSSVGHIYLMSCAGYTKIGITNDIKNRLSGIQVSNPVEVKLIFSRNIECCKEHELFLHNAYWERNVRGEWFLLNECEIQDIIGRLKSHDEIPVYVPIRRETSWTRNIRERQLKNRTSIKTRF